MTILVPTLIQSQVKLQVKCLCVVMFLSFPLSMAEVPGPCRHSITRDHLLKLKHLMDNQLRSGCSITYTFIEQKSLSKCCFVKAALPWILELLTTHFKYNRGSVNYTYVQSLRTLILNIYSQKCVPQINEEVEDKPESFEVLYRGSPGEALQKASRVLSVYLELVTKSDAPMNWSCQYEYSKFLSSSTEQPKVSPTQGCTDSYVTRSVKASQRRPLRDLYKLGFIITSIFGALLLLFILFCLITQKRPLFRHRLGSYMSSSRDQQG
ncbi:macrophage colony-stimulating factor 1b isoform X3 [Phyllopteryx taeniolatus]|uniref:macrophage colony-stimulating factor 1b isoform X3 n=1 Tax=Phyllopteryx taeniolatus TaxID=161469 RepID=UPI002AD25D11|nr:macrophage colony-stimulating factor 1b isoform X3 [Phyllopteryx taeniolatus]